MHFCPLLCWACHQAIRGSHFECIGDHIGEPRGQVFCETCARSEKHPLEHLRKVSKHCLLSTALTDEEARNTCTCPQVTDEGKVYPFSEGGKSTHHITCPLIHLKSRHCQAKLRDLNELHQLHDVDVGTNGATIPQTLISVAGSVIRHKIQKDIPYGNVHMGLMLGPLVIENGIPK